MTAICLAMASAAVRCSPWGTTRLTMPRASARSAPSVSWPVSNRAFAAFGPARHLLLQVEAGREAAAGAGQHDRAHLGIGFQAVERLVDLKEHDFAERVDALRAVELQVRDASVALDPDRFVAFHRYPS